MKIVELLEQKSDASLYRSGMCDAFAIALHDLTNYPLAAWGGTYYDDFEEEDVIEYCHVVVTIPNSNKWIDVDGIHDSPPDNCFFNNDVKKLQLYPISRDEATYIYSMEGVSENDIDRAIAYIKSKPQFASLIS
jgi:hypothetical protein